MKIRSDFVTNSSSSSFVIAFNDKQDLENFIQKCDSDEYREFYEFIVSSVSDYLVIDNIADTNLSFDDIVEEIKNRNIPLPVSTQSFIDNAGGLKIKPYGDLWIPLYNPFACDEMPDEDLYSMLLDLEEDSWDADDMSWGAMIIDRSSCRKKSTAEAVAKDAIAGDYIHELLEKNVPRKDIEDYSSCFKRRVEYKETDEFLNAVEGFLQRQGYPEIHERIKNALLVLNMEARDIDDDDLGAAIRRGYVKKNFGECFISQLDIG